MKNLLTRGLVLSGAVLAASATLYAPAASASKPPAVKLTMVGSNTTQELMGAVTGTFNSSATAVDENASATNVYAQPADPGTVAPSDVNCNGGTAITYIQESDPGANQRTAPNGSGAGRTALMTSVSNGDSCTSVARSSSPPADTDPAGTQAYAYAVDAVTWTTSSTTAAPANLSMTKLEGVYNCTYKNWDQVGGANAPIVRYFPQEGSGSASFFSGVMGFDPRTLGGVNKCTTAPTLIEENEATQVAAGDLKGAIMIYSSGAWIAQANGVDPDMRNGFVLNTINSKESPVTMSKGKYVTSGLVAEKNVEPAAYQPKADNVAQGVRNLFNFINTNSVDYADAKTFVGPGSRLCTDKDASAVVKYGFAALSSCVLVPEPS